MTSTLLFLCLLLFVPLESIDRKKVAKGKERQKRKEWVEEENKRQDEDRWQREPLLSSLLTLASIGTIQYRIINFFIIATNDKNKRRREREQKKRKRKKERKKEGEIIIVFQLKRS